MEKRLKKTTLEVSKFLKSFFKSSWEIVLVTSKVIFFSSFHVGKCTCNGNGIHWENPEYLMKQVFLAVDEKVKVVFAQFFHWKLFFIKWIILLTTELSVVSLVGIFHFRAFMWLLTFFRVFFTIHSKLFLRTSEYP